jgi:hypothetical protein
MGRDPYFPPAALRLVSGERRARGTPEKIIGPAMFERLERSIENYAPAAHGREHVLLDRLAAVYDQRVADVKEAASEHSQRTASAISSARPILPIGSSEITLARPSAVPPVKRRIIRSTCPAPGTMKSSLGSEACCTRAHWERS